MGAYSVDLPKELYQRLQRQAASERRTVDEWVQQVLVRQLPVAIAIEDELSPLLKDELRAMAQLSDDALWALLKNMLSSGQQDELELLSEIASERDLTEEEATRRQELLRQYHEVMLRRAHAAVLLQSRGYDVSDPALLHS